MSTSYKQFTKSVSIQAFIINLFIALLVIAPILIRNNGIFALSHDFNAQSLPFQLFMHDTLNSRNFIWNWAIDIGGNFLEAFSFYCLGSPFTLITMICPKSLLPYMIGWMIIFKFAITGMTSAFFLESFISKKRAIIIASILYSFSGFQCSSIIFHFQDVVALFPLMLVGLDQLVQHKRRGFFLLTVFLNCFCNYIFFVGEVLFVVLYFVIRYLIPNVKKGKEAMGAVLSDILNCFLEGTIGVMLSGVLLFPGIWSMLSNSRASSHLPVESWFNMSTQSWLTMIRAFFLPGETMNRCSSVLTSDWMTNAAYLPVFGMVFVIAYLLKPKKDDWLGLLLKVCIVVACIPVLNNLFMALSAESYRRWYYMFILFMALATGIVLEKLDEYKREIKHALLISAVILIVFVILTAILPWNNSGDSLIYGKYRYAICLIIAVFGFLCTWILLHLKKPFREHFSLVSVSLMSMCLLCYTILGYQLSIDNTGIDFKKYKNSYGENVVNYLTEMPERLPQDTLPYRYYFNEGIGYTYYNLGMANSLPTINSFTSTAHSSITEFYDALGYGRGTMTPEGPVGTKELLSARYIISLVPLDGYDLVTVERNRNGQDILIYENKNALPIGFSYNSYLPKSEFLSIPRNERAIIMLETLVVEDADISKVEGILKKYDVQNDRSSSFSETRTQKDCSGDFSVGKNRFRSEINARERSFALFSVPYDRFWHAAVNGQEVEILNTNGLMAVPLERGLNSIEFTYHYLPVYAGGVCSVLGLFAGIVYILGFRRSERDIFLHKGDVGK